MRLTNWALYLEKLPSESKINTTSQSALLQQNAISDLMVSDYGPI